MAKRRVAVIVFLLCLGLSRLPCYARAASAAEVRERISPDRNCELTVTYRYDGTGFSEHPVKLYQIADVSADLQYRLTEPFADSGLILNGVQSVGEWNVIRSTLETHILAHGVDAGRTELTDENGQVCFRALKPGLYLATTGKVIQNGWTYLFDSALIALPGLGAEGLWQYEVSVASKSRAEPPAEADRELAFKVLKLWKGDNGPSDRPQSIEVELFRDGVSYETVVLSEENHWTFSWSAKNDGAVWKVAERNVPDGYTVTVEERETTFILTNTRPPDKPAPPKTGDTVNIMLYIVVMNISGMVLIGLGLAGKRRRV